MKLCKCGHGYHMHHSPGGGWAGYGDECSQCQCIDYAESRSKFTVGSTVMTTKDAGEKDWSGGVRDNCRWNGVHGVVKRVHDSHGIVYMVEHDDGAIAYYSEGEVN